MYLEPGVCCAQECATDVDMAIRRPWLDAI